MTRTGSVNQQLIQLIAYQRNRVRLTAICHSMNRNFCIETKVERSLQTMPHHLRMRLFTIWWIRTIQVNSKTIEHVDCSKKSNFTHWSMIKSSYHLRMLHIPIEFHLFRAFHTLRQTHNEYCKRRTHAAHCKLLCEQISTTTGGNQHTSHTHSTCFQKGCSMHTTCSYRTHEHGRVDRLFSRPRTSTAGFDTVQQFKTWLSHPFVVLVSISPQYYIKSSSLGWWFKVEGLSFVVIEC